MKTKKVEVLLPYQKKWVEDDSEQKISEKSRRIGISYTEALNSVLKAGPAKGAVNTYYLSYNKDMTRQFIQDCAEWAERFEVATSGIIEDELLDGDRAVKTYRLDFASGAEICALPSEAYVLRSKKGRVVFDEAAFCVNFDAVIKAAQALLIWGGQLSVISTHNGEDNPFNLLIQDIRKGRNTSWSLHKTTFREAVEDGLYKRICLMNGTKYTKDSEDSWIEKIYGIYKDNASEELDVIPASGSAKYFSRGILYPCVREDVPVIRWEFPDEFLHKSDTSKKDRIEKLFRREVEPKLRCGNGKLFFGLDFARSGDLTVYWVTEQDGTRCNTRLILEVKNCPFREQEQTASLMLKAAKLQGQLGGMAIDSRGNGQSLAENISLDYPGATGVMETKSWYAEWFPKLKALMETEDFTLPEDETVLSDFSVVQMKEGNPYVPDTRVKDRDGKSFRHGDAACAAVLACYAVYKCACEPAPVFLPVEGAEKDYKKKKSFFGIF